jgi:Protein of unknown function (DUF3043)
MLTVVSEAPSPDEGAATGKGRPTPKRRDAQKRRRVATPTNRKEAAAARRQRLREQRSVQRQALMTGDERNLPPRDAGPAKRLARDIVDSRFTLGQIFFGMILVMLVLSFIRNNYIAVVTQVVMLAAFAAVVYDAVRVGRIARRAVAGKYGERESMGVTSYALMRALQPRRMRRPPARIKRGDAVT